MKGQGGRKIASDVGCNDRRMRKIIMHRIVNTTKDETSDSKGDMQHIW